MKEIIIPVSKDGIRKLPDPYGLKRDIVFVHCQLKNLPLDIPLEINPRSQNTKSRVAHEIRHGLLEDTKNFHLLNRGITITAKETTYDNSLGLLKIILSESKDGAIDGGHSFAVIREMLEEGRANGNAFVRLEILSNVHPIITKLAKARNTSAQVKDESLANLQGKFDWIKDILDKETFGPKIAYRENEDDDEKPIDIREVIGLMTLFHPNFEGVDTPPIIGYSSKSKCLDFFCNPDLQVGYYKLRNILPTILKLYDYIQLRFPTIYEEIGGFSGIQNKKIDKVKLGKVIEVRKYEKGFNLDYLQKTIQFRFPDAWILPILGSLRALVKYKTVASWKVDNPYVFFDKYGDKYITQTLESSKESGRGTPNAVGKNKEHWMVLHQLTKSFYLSLLNVDTEKEVVV